MILISTEIFINPIFVFSYNCNKIKYLNVREDSIEKIIKDQEDIIIFKSK